MHGVWARALALELGLALALLFSSAAAEAGTGDEPAHASEPVRLALGNGFGCGLGAAGEVKCWGYNRGGAAGQPLGRVIYPTRVAGLPRAVDLQAGFSFACALTDKGEVWCWGSNRNRELGDPTIATRWKPGRVPGIQDATALTVGGFHACALLSRGQVVCWGSNRTGQLGTRGAMRAQPKPVPKVRATALWAGLDFTCARDRKGELRCWGGGLQGQLGNSKRVKIGRPLTNTVRGAGGKAAIELGRYHGCTLQSASAGLACWGANLYVPTNRGFFPKPTPIPGTAGATDFAVGREEQCVVRAGKVLCRGVNRMNHLAVPSKEMGNLVSAPSAKPEIDDAVEVTMGGYVVCVRRSSASRPGWWCWGRNSSDAVGVGSGELRVVKPTRLRWNQNKPE